MGQEIVKETPFRLYQDDPIIEVSDGTANTFTDIWTYQVPQGMALIIKPYHTFAAYIYDAGAEVGDATCQIKIEKRDASGTDVEILYGPDLYLASKEFQEQVKMAKFTAVAEAGVVIEPRQKLVITIKDDGTIDESACYFELHIAKIYKTLGA